MYDILDRICKRAGLKAITARDLRRAYVISLIRGGRTRNEVQYLTGHASWVTNAVYEELAGVTDKGGYDLLRLPYKPTAGAS